MDWIQVFTIIISLGGIIYWFKSDLEKDIQRLDVDVKSQNARLDLEAKSQNIRTDQLYQMFIDLLREKRNP